MVAGADRQDLVRGRQSLPAIWTGVFTDLDLLPQCKIGRHVQRALPYDRLRVVAHPTESFWPSLGWEDSLFGCAYDRPRPPSPRGPDAAYLTPGMTMITLPTTPSPHSAADTLPPSLTQTRR